MTLKPYILNVINRILTLILIQFSFLGMGQNSGQYVLILGIAQDGGYPHIGCTKSCCDISPDSTKKFVSSLALVDAVQKKWWLFEATPDITAQLDLMQTVTNHQFSYLPNGIFLTHAHIGHYTGLMYLGREALGSKSIPVYVLPKMGSFLINNGPWSQLIKLENIKLNVLQADQPFKLSSAITIKPFLVPHRDEFSETAGFQINTSSKKYLFIPDIDKWSKWNKALVEEVKKIDVAFIDGSFYSADELHGRDMSEVPHPLVSETVRIFSDSNEKMKIVFIHFNHTNPLLWNSIKRNEFIKSGFRLGVQGARY